MAFESWLASLELNGEGPIEMRPIKRSTAYTEVLTFSGDLSGDTFDVDIKTAPGGSSLAEFTVSVGSYSASTDSTTLTLTMTSGTAALGGVTANTTDYVTTLVVEGLRNALPFFGGIILLQEKVADGS